MAWFLGEEVDFVRCSFTGCRGGDMLPGHSVGENSGSWGLDILESVQGFAGFPEQDSIVGAGDEGMDEDCWTVTVVILYDLTFTWRPLVCTLMSQPWDCYLKTTMLVCGHWWAQKSWEVCDCEQSQRVKCVVLGDLLRWIYRFRI